MGAFQEVLINLLENAREILRAGQSVELSARVEAGMFHVVVQDDGPGLGEMPEKFFRPFISDRKGGTGLGLAISRRVCEASAGTLTGVNAPAGGAIFTISLPLRGEGPGCQVAIQSMNYDPEHSR